jgi:hypothetical protein
MRAPEVRVEHESSLAREPAAELDVLDRCVRVPVRVEPACRPERIDADGAEAGPEGDRVARGALVDHVVEEVAKARDRAAREDTVVVRPEDADERRVTGERGADARERIGVHENVRVDEDDDVGGHPLRALVPRRRRPDLGRARHDDDLLGRLGGVADGLEAAPERRMAVRGRDDDAQPDGASVPIDAPRRARAPAGARPGAGR